MNKQGEGNVKIKSSNQRMMEWTCWKEGRVGGASFARVSIFWPSEQSHQALRVKETVTGYKKAYIHSGHGQDQCRMAQPAPRVVVSCDIGDLNSTTGMGSQI